MSKKILFMLAGMMALPAIANAQDSQIIKLYENTIAGGMTITGNAIGLSYAHTPSATSSTTKKYCIGTSDGIGAFMTLKADATPVPACSTGASSNFPAGTTISWADNGSMAVLDLPAGAKVVHAELIWAASYKSTKGVTGTSTEDLLEDLTEVIDTPVLLKKEDGSNKGSMSVTPGLYYTDTGVQAARAPSKAYASTDKYEMYYYTYSADVTNFFKDSKTGEQLRGSGKYSVNGIPASADPRATIVNGGGWTLVVVYSNPPEDKQTRNITIFVQGDTGKIVEENKSVDYIANGFCAPASGAINGKVFVSAMEGDANDASSYFGDYLKIGKDASTLKSLSGPNNHPDNFFASQINTDDGKLDKRGTFGDRNHNYNPKTGKATLVAGARQGWDITSVPINGTYNTNYIVNDQKQALIQASAHKDSYLPTLVGFQLDVYAPSFQNKVLNVPKSSVSIGSDFIATLTLPNEGGAKASNVYAALWVYSSSLTAKEFRINGGPWKTSKILDAGEYTVFATTDILHPAASETFDVDQGSTTTVEFKINIPKFSSVGDSYHYLDSEIYYKNAVCDNDNLKESVEVSNYVEIELPYLNVAFEKPGKDLGGGKMEYTVTVSNLSYADATNASVNLNFGDITYVPGSLMISVDGGTPVSGTIDSAGNVTLPAGALAGRDYDYDTSTIGPEHSVTLTFSVQNSSTGDVNYTITATGDPDGYVGQLPAVSDSVSGSFGHCGNGVLDAGEECEPSLPHVTAGSCNEQTCKANGGHICITDEEGNVWCDVDSDGDGLPDNYEVRGCDGNVYTPAKADWDCTDPQNPDTDGDGLCDGTIVVANVCDGTESDNNTNPGNADTDGDGLCDGRRVVTGVCDDTEIHDNCDCNFKTPDTCSGSGTHTYCTNPLNADTDGDGIPDYTEIHGGGKDCANKTNGICDGGNPTNPINSDSDGDGLCDGKNSKGYVTDSNNNIICEESEDNNNNGKIDSDETDPNKADTDGDGISDYVEIHGGSLKCDPSDTNCIKCQKDNQGKCAGGTITDPLNPDSDKDGVCDGSKSVMDGATEVCFGGEDRNDNGRYEANKGETNPTKYDTDNGGVSDGNELRACPDHRYVAGIVNCLDPLDGSDDVNYNNGNNQGGDNGNHDGSEYIDDDCACQSVLATHTTRFPALASIFALIGAAFLGLRRRKEAKN